MTPSRRSIDSDGSQIVSAQDFGAVQATLEATVKVLDKHLLDCYDQNKEVAKNVRNLTIAVAVLAGAVLGEDRIIKVLEWLF